MEAAMKPHSFSESLAFSRRASDWDGWQDLYCRFFGHGVQTMRHDGDGWHQRAGIDRTVVLPDSRRFLVDEKARGRNRKTGQVYDDIALEYLSDRAAGTPGWVCKPLACDYIAYAILPLGKAWLLPVLQLQSAWAVHGSEWMDRYGKIPAVNERWVTMFTPVPERELFMAMGSQFRARFTPFECEE